MSKKFLIILLLVSFSLTCNKGEAPTEFYDLQMEAELLAVINNHRSAKQLAPFKRDAILEREARTHTRNMAEHKVGVDHTGLADRIYRLTRIFGDSIVVAENVTYGHRTANYVLQWWLSKSADLANIEGDYQYIGIGAAQNSDKIYYYTALFMRIDTVK